MSENQKEENHFNSSIENKLDRTFHFITYKSSDLDEGKYKFDSITNKLIENYYRIYDFKIKLTYIFNPESENILQTEYPKLILNKNSYNNNDIPLILKEITRIDKIDISDLEPKEKESFKREISDTVFNKWLEIENSLFYELEKLFYVFFCLHSRSKKYLMVTGIKNFIKLFYDPNLNFFSWYRNHKAMKDFCSLYDIESAKDCLKKIINVLESIDSFLAEMRSKIKMLSRQSEKFAEIFKERIFSYDITIYTVFLVFKEFFRDDGDILFLKNTLKNSLFIKYEQYQKENEKLNMRDIDNEDNDYLGLDYMKYKNKKLSDDENYLRFTLRMFFPEIIKTVEYYERIKLNKETITKAKLDEDSFKNLEDHKQTINDYDSFGNYPESASNSIEKKNGTANKLVFTTVFFGLLFFLKIKYAKK